MEQKFRCPKCNASLEEDVWLCGNCREEIVWQDGQPKLKTDSLTPQPTHQAPVEGQASPTPQPAPKPKKRSIGRGCLWIVGLLILVAIIGGMCGGEPEADAPTTSPPPTSEAPAPTPPPEPTPNPHLIDPFSIPERDTTPAPAPSVTPQPSATLGEQNAAKSAQEYLAVMAFSYSGLVDQLKFEGFTHEEAVYGVDQSGADWNEQAAKSAQEYLATMSFSRDGLITQLEFEGFTRQQAEYGVKAVGY